MDGVGVVSLKRSLSFSLSLSSAQQKDLRAQNSEIILVSHKFINLTGRLAAVPCNSSCKHTERTM